MNRIGHCGKSAKKIIIKKKSERSKEANYGARVAHQRMKTVKNVCSLIETF